MDINNINIISQLKTVPAYLLLYLKNPLNALKKTPDWGLPLTIAIQIIFSVFIGTISDTFSEFSLFRDVWFFPLSSLFTAILGTGFFYFLVLVLFDKELPFQKLYLTVFLSHIPFLFLRLFKTWIAPIELIGFMATTALLTVGFVENFALPKHKMIRISSIIFLVYFISWSAQQISNSKKAIEIQKQIQIDKKSDAPSTSDFEF